MNNIYDIILNFNKYYYEVYEWKNSDNIENIRKISFFKVDNEDFINLKYKDVKINNKTLEYLKKCCYIFDDEFKEVCFLVTNGCSCMGLIVNDKGYVIARSAMLYDEEDEVLDECSSVCKLKFYYDKIVDIDVIDSRLEYEKKELLYNFINNISDKMILKYIYYDYYLKECDDVRTIRNNLLNDIKICDYDNLFRLYDCVKVFNNYVK